MVLNHLSSLWAYAYSLTIPELSSLLLVSFGITMGYLHTR